MNSFIELLIVEKGIPETSIILLLMLPLVATIIAFWRQIIGLRTFGIYAPIFIIFAFYQMGVTTNGMNILQAIKYGTGLAFVVFLSASIAHEVTRKIRLHYVPKMSLVLSTVAAAVFAILTLAAYMDRGGFVSIDPLPILLLITVSEQMISLYIKKGRKKAYLLTFMTLLISILTYLLISSSKLQSFVLTYPYVILLTFPLNLIIGKWKGFRLKEYFRFRNLLTPSESD